MYNNTTLYWSPVVSINLATAVNDQDRGNAIVIFMQGLTVEYVALSGGYYTVTATGKIKDSGNIYDIQKTLGAFQFKPK